MHLRLLLAAFIFTSPSKLTAGQPTRLEYTTKVTATIGGRKQKVVKMIQPFHLTVHFSEEGKPYALYCHPLAGKKSGNLLPKARTLYQDLQKLQKQEPEKPLTMHATLYGINMCQVIQYLSDQKKPDHHFYMHALVTALTSELIQEHTAYEDPNNPKPLPPVTLLDIVETSIAELNKSNSRS